MSERTPLLHYRLSNSVNESENRPSPAGVAAAQSPAVSRRKTANNQPPKLSTFFGVVIPTLLSMFSVVVFLRIGFVVGQAGLYQAIGMFLVAYFIISMTVLSVCAISTNGALDAGGAYYMISRALGPEFGGSIGIMFFFANVCGSALYVLGLVEAVIATFGIPEDTTAVARTASQVLPQGYWWSLLYGTVILLLCLLVCLVGAHIYAKATFLIFIIVIVVLATIFISFFAVSPRQVLLPPSPPNTSSPSSANFTGFKLDTLLANLEAGYTVDYTTGIQMTFATVFAVMFNGCTGIMAGSNMSGDLKNPSYSIPRGTITAVIFTFIIYNLLSVLVACSCDRILLQRDYSFLRDINVWHPLVTIGVYSSTLSAAMSNLIGASRILYALARDDLFGKALSPAKRTSRSGNPWTSVLISWFLVQLVLFSGKLNTIASIVTIFFLLVYAAVDLACLALEWASAPNFRPTFRYFTWHTCVLGILGCAVMMFLINAIYASASIAFMLLLLLLIHYLSPTSSWGYISQALIFHQVLTPVHTPAHISQALIFHQVLTPVHTPAHISQALIFHQVLTPVHTPAHISQALIFHQVLTPVHTPAHISQALIFHQVHTPVHTPAHISQALIFHQVLTPVHTPAHISQALIFHQVLTPVHTPAHISQALIFHQVLKPVHTPAHISQALIFHQVRKYLLMLDVRKDHVKFWRPQVLLMVANPRGSTSLITFINDIKKSGLYVLGHVELGDLDLLPSDPLQSRYDSWLSLVDHLNIKAFVNLTLASSVRHGVQHLLFISGLGGMRPNTLVLGFYDDCSPEDKLLDPAEVTGNSADAPGPPQDPEDQLTFAFPSLRGGGEGTGKGGAKALGPQEYVAVIADAVKMLKNVALARYFCRFDRAAVLGRRSGGAGLYVDVWPLNLLRPDSSSYVDTCSLFLLQLACVLNMVRAWRRARLRLFLCVETGRSLRGSEEKLRQLLKDLRIKADIHTVPWDQVAALHWQRQGEGGKGGRNEEDEGEEKGAVEEEEEDDYVNSFPSNTTRLSDEYLHAVNALLQGQSSPPPAVRFLYLPRPPADTRRYSAYLRQLDLLTRDLGPTLLIHGVTPVITTDL
ncbi:solute carrier family 12 member 9 isoform X1 [Anguilla anguilla]|uniref:solute carrier family 12 member 9 isoform X1 n=1 Tax=Anguilla anguilla TaxID=7936 RepID=UPI0015ADE2CF|nr:solute carrier family 12 member 9 isoform X1 [Anguilla anguilla]